jgi:hypothetical protein
VRGGSADSACALFEDGALDAVGGGAVLERVAAGCEGASEASVASCAGSSVVSSGACAEGAMHGAARSAKSGRKARIIAIG